MNRFRKNKKGKDTSEEMEAIPSPVSTTSSLFKKNKKEEPEPPTPEFDLENALPSADQFRTSLLMPKLSARFSMLREQDDPTTKVGKANDDSVLFPKRASRLNLFGHNPSLLSDIAEVSSIHGRPSLALSDGSNGTDDEVSQTGSIMSRGRPGEGNVLFGGRQRIYKVPINGGSGLRGRALYDDDVTLSAFQRLRLHEKEEEKQEEAATDSLQDSTVSEFEDSSPAFSTKRTTSSSTTSGRSNHRTSTAATSIDEQSITGSQQAPSNPSASNQTSPSKPSWPPPSADRNATKTRRLYGQGLAQAVQDQQSSALNRLENINRQRAGAETPEIPRLNREFSKSATNLRDRPSRLSPVQAAPVYQGNSPPPSASSPKSHAQDVHHKDAASSANGTARSTGYGSAPPLSPPVSETEEAATLAAALQPEDRGKATAMGLFNKPSTPYDEQQFTRRQLQMHEGRNTPPLRRNSRSNSVVQPDSIGRPRGLSNASYRSKAESVSSRYSNDAHLEASPARATNNTFLMNLSASDSESDVDNAPLKKVPSSRSQAFDGIHPAFRSRPVSRDSDSQPPTRGVQNLPELRYSDIPDLSMIEENQAAEAPPSPIPEEASEEAPDSPTLGPSGLGLSGLIRAHLRQPSNASSIYPPPSPGLPPQQQDQSPEHATRESHSPASVRSNLWEYDDLRGKKQAAPEEHSTAASNISMRARELRDQAAALREQQSESRAGSRAENYGQRSVSPWQEEVKFTHRRDASTETQKEREEFANELAERRRRVQENLKNLGDIESRSSSPVPGRQTPDLNQPKHGNAFAMLKNRSMKHTPLGKQDSSQPKGLKMFGLGSGSTTMSASTPSLVSSDSWREEETVRNLGTHPNSSSPHLASGRNISSRVPPSRNSRGSQDDPRESSSSRGPSPIPFNGRQRDRSTSGSGRSQSRTRPRDDPPSVPTSARPSLEVNDRSSYERSASAASGRYRSNSRAAAPGYFDLNSIGEDPRPSPVTPYSANTTPPLPDPDTEGPKLSLSSSDIPQRAPGSNGLQKRVVDKSKISEPTFVSSTYNVPTVGLPAGASLSNGMETPPIPPMNPRRRQGSVNAWPRQQAMKPPQTSGGMI
ncbi:hypothetical protein VTN77DRAFT_1754 [Rasamsonia byssochlamydoides]|uniref:uncharacterized protein n=1 Tax=Rasamsonia byssochlamydoides TaxID=89139 RepID=UPI003742196D